jgi:hypothetical protein
MNKGYMIIEASLILPLVILILIFCISFTLFSVIKTDIELDMNMIFLKTDDSSTVGNFSVDLPLAGVFGIKFEERKKDTDYGMRIQRSRIPGDILKE